MQAFTFRLKPGQDLFNEIEAFVAEKNVEAGCILSSVGSLTHATFRLANREYFSEYDGHFEIVSMTGTVSVHGIALAYFDFRWGWEDDWRPSGAGLQDLYYGRDGAWGFR